MSNAKKFISVILAMIMVCSTLVVGANAAYTAYKDEAITKYDDLDKPVLTTEQYASAALDELDRMLNKEQIKLTSDDLFGIGELDVTSVDATMTSVYNLLNSGVFTSFSGLLGDLKNLKADSFKPESEGGVRRTTEDNSDIDVIYAILGFLYENKDIFVDFVKGDIDLGTILPSVVDISEYTDVNALLRGLLYDATYPDATERPADLKTNSDYTFDNLAQTLINNIVLKEVPELEGYTNISEGTMYDFIDNLLKVLFNSLIVDLLNGNVKYEINKFCGVTEIVTDDDYNIESSNKTTVNKYAELINVDYTFPEYEFTSASFVSQANDLLGAAMEAMLTSDFYGSFTWETGSNDYLLDNLINVAKIIVTDTDISDAFFQPYNTRYTTEEINAMSAQELITYLLRVMINNSADEIYVPESATTLREFGYYCLSQLLATAAPELDFSSMDKDSTDTLVIMGIDFAIYNINAVLDMGLKYVTTMEGVDEQLANAAKYGVNNYGGLLNGITFRDSTDGWGTLDDIIFSIIDVTWLPTEVSSAEYPFKTLLIDVLIDGILDLDVANSLAKLENNHKGGLNDKPVKVVLDLAVKIINIIFPGAVSTTATTFEQIASNENLSGTVNAVFSDLYNYRTKLVAAILPTLCSILDLTNAQEFEFPEYTYETSYFSGGLLADIIEIPVRNGSTGINTGYTDEDGKFHQDQLYTYEFGEITTNDDAITATIGTTKLAGGETTTISCSGSPTSGTSGVIRIDVPYKVITEDGSYLSSEEFVDHIYTYLTNSNSDNITPIKTTNGLYTVSSYSNNYVDSFDALCNIEIEVTSSQTEGDITADIVVNTSTTSLTKLLGTGWVELATDQKIANAFVDTDSEVYPVKSTIKLFQPTQAYLDLPEEASEDNPDQKTKADAWAEIIKTGSTINSSGVLRKYASFANMKLGVEIEGTVRTASTTVFSVYPYNEYGIASTLEDELEKHRQATNYTAGWDAYQTAMNTAAAAVYAPFSASSFTTLTTGKVALIESANTALTAAIETLDKNEIGGGFDEILATIAEINPENIDDDGNALSYNDPNYKFFGVADYEAYTYYNYKDEYEEAMDAYTSTIIPDEEGNVKTVSALTVINLQHRLELYAGRLLKKSVIKTHLVQALAGAIALTAENEELYTAESWANYKEAYDFATLVNTTANESLTQTKVNTAYEVLLNMQKKLVVASGEGGDVPEFNPVDPDTGNALTVIEATSGDVYLGGITPGADPTTLFTGSGFTVETVQAGTKIATGDTITVKNASTGEVVATYTVCISGDVDGDGDAASPFDLSIVRNSYNALSTINELKTAAADISGNDGTVDAFDVSAMSAAANALKSIDYVNRTIK